MGWEQAVRLHIVLLTWRDDRWEAVRDRGKNLNMAMGVSFILGWLSGTLECLKEKLPRWQKGGPSL